MIFAASDVSSLAVSLERWEWAEYASCALVALGCTGEYIAEFTDCWTGGLKEKQDRLAKRSTLLLISALALELICLVKTNSISGLLIGSLSEKAGVADTKAQSALDKSFIAETKADASVASSANATISAHDARLEADSFEKDIVSAKTKAAEAESHLAEALKQAAAAQAELNRLKSPRSLTNVAALVSTLEPFKGMEFTFSGVFQDQESTDLADEISVVLKRAGWKPADIPGLGTLPSYIKLKNFGIVGFTISTGIHLEAGSTEKLETLQALGVAKLPTDFQAAFALRAALASSVSPSQDNLATSSVGVRAFRSAVLIEVGKKP